MAPEKRKLMVVGTAIAAVVALPGCAPAGYRAADYGNAVEPASDQVAASPTATAPATGNANDEADPPKVDDDLLTTSLTGSRVKRMGKVVEDQDGFVLYRFDDDEESKSRCDGDCAKVWPPALTGDGKPTLKGVDRKLVGTVTRTDGTEQLTLKGWPLYRYAGDRKPGQWLGQNVGEKWFVINPDGSKNLTCLPKPSKPIPVPDDEDEGNEENDSGGAGSDYSY